MARFSVICKNQDGETIRQTRVGASREEVLGELRNAGMVPVSVRVSGEVGPESEEKSQSRKIHLFSRVKLEDLAYSFRAFATMLGGGLTMLDCLQEVGEDTDNRRLQEVFLDVRRQVQGGTELNKAMENYPRVFSPMIRAVVHAGQESGTLTEVLRSLAEYLERRVEIKRKIKSGTRYPMFIIGVFFAAMAVIFFYVLPKFKVIFEDFGANLPIFTRMVMGFTDAVIANIIWILPGVVLGVIGLIVFKRTDRGKSIWDRFVLAIPVLGHTLHLLDMTRVARSMGLLMDSGLSVVDALELSEEVADNTVVVEALAETRRHIVQGSSLAEELRYRKGIPRLMASMAAAGEQSGNVGDMLTRAGVHFQDEASNSVEALLSLLEPTLIVLMGVVVGIMVIAVYLPIFHLAEAALGG